MLAGNKNLSHYSLGELLMLKKLLLGTVLLSTSLFSQAGVISLIDGADMAGMEVTAYFANGTNDTQIWAATGSDSGAAASSEWSLSLSGETFGNVPSPGVFIGVWEFNNISNLSGVVGIEINAAAGDIYFDNIASVEHTVGSGFGREIVFDPDNAVNVTSAFSDVYSGPDLHGTLDINWNAGTSLELGETLQFFIDTDKVSVSEPATALVFLTGLLALVNIRRNKA